MNRQRRRFLKAAAAGGVAYAFGRTPGTVWAQSAGTGGFADYKALVCLFLFGGNDSWNMVVPTSTAEYNAYSRSRGGGTTSSLAIDRTALLPVTRVGQVAGDPTFGFHPSMTGVRDLFNAGRLAVLPNVGPLIAPTTKAQYQTAASTGHPLPPQLFSHNDQQDQWHSLRGRTVMRSGWGGRVADVLASRTADQQLALNVSLAGQTFFQAGEVARPYVSGATGAATFTGFGTTGVAGGRKTSFEAVLAASTGSTGNTMYERGFATVQQRAIRYADRVNAAIAAGPNFAALPNTGVTLTPLQTQLRTVAKMIASRAQLSMSRQIFFVSVGGFDQHDFLLQDQPGLLTNVSNSIKLFHDAMGEIGMQQSVTLFTHSDFGRTLTSNGDGSDHAWGGVQLVAGGAVRGGQFYGEYPLLEIGSVLEVGGGRMIPTVSADQYAATLASWFGVTDADLAKVAPSINNFGTRNLGFMA
ncbi:MAG: DUF1501 domain-containing protein [Gammaproteobacteria bacterium]|nr:DUF1501 domain-containing protein [Gammaproteobacteria bacterium]